jgi:hypothetical protein
MCFLVLVYSICISQAIFTGLWAGIARRLVQNGTESAPTGVGKRRRFPLVCRRSQMLGYGVFGTIVVIVLVVWLVRAL